MLTHLFIFIRKFPEFFPSQMILVTEYMRDRETDLINRMEIIMNRTGEWAIRKL